ncbi:MAG: hypothetical protein QXV69_01435 [Sulfolobaceae archaeon]
MSLEKIFDIISDRVKNELKENFNQAVSEVNRIIENEYSRILNIYISKITEIINQAKERIEGEKAKLDIELKRLIMNEKGIWLQRVYEETLKNLENFLSSESYKKGLKNILERESLDNAIIYCSENDEKLVKSLVSNRNVKVVKDRKIKGGIKIEYTDQGLVKDYTIDLILNQVFEAMKGKIAEILFGGI